MLSVYLRASIPFIFAFPFILSLTPSTPQDQLQLDVFKNLQDQKITKIFTHEFMLPALGSLEREYWEDNGTTYTMQLIDVTLRFKKLQRNVTEYFMCSSQNSSRTGQATRNVDCCWLGQSESQHVNQYLVVFNQCTDQMFGIIKSRSDTYQIHPLSRDEHHGRHSVSKVIPKKNEDDDACFATREDYSDRTVRKTTDDGCVYKLTNPPTPCNELSPSVTPSFRRFKQNGVGDGYYKRPVDMHQIVYDSKKGNPSSYRFQNKIDCQDNAERMIEPPSPSQRRHHIRYARSSKGNPTIEVLVAADQSMVAFHGNETVRKYVLTIFNTVANLFHDSSLGTSVDVVVSDLIILSGKEENLSVTNNADKTMRSFCDWQRDSKDAETKHDVALLITRLNICADKDQPCGTVGMAYIGGMCQSRRRCSLAEDTGLDVALTIAHELGHNLGIQHDGYGNDCADQTRDIPHIMAATWLKGNKRGVSKWSTCSKKGFKKYLRSSHSWCLKETRSTSVIPLPSAFPGVSFSADDQCKHNYGNLARQCRHYQGRLCEELWCEIEGEFFCRTRMSPPAAGTKCAEGKWCMYGNCVNNTSILIKQNGGWNSWGEWVECSRSCGTGVSINRRKCDNPRTKNGGRYCVGMRERYRLCNTKPCPANSKSIRTVQCEAYNGRKYKNQTYNWKPLLSKYKPCSLYCTPTTEERFSLQLSAKVIDGTPCRPESADLCVDGKCHKVGCDQKIGSDAKEDICGVCKGNGSTCRTIEGSFNQLSGSGYVEVAVIPIGARNIQVMESKPCTSFLALKGSLDTYYVNGNWKIQLPGQVDVDGTKVFYDRKGTWERLVAKGPTKELLHVMVLYHGFNLGIKYKYSIPTPNKSQEVKDEGKISKGTPRKTVNYGWVRRGWEKCSVVCGSGVQKSRKEECIRFVNGSFKVVDKAFCSRATKPKREIHVCNEHACPIWWSVTRWNKCSRECGSGRQHRQVLCMSQFANGTVALASNHTCTKDQPSSVQNCFLRSCRVKWAVKSWTKCFSVCGKGYRFRSVFCPINGLCDPATKPTTRKRCYGASCYSWNAGEWGKCSRSCGRGYQQRSVKCENKLNKDIGRNCSLLKRPSHIRICRNRPCKIKYNIAMTRYGPISGRSK